jgi:uncharacterized protein YndB with AHSA1/START domain
MIPGKGTEALIVRRRIQATREELFAEWTDTESIGMWLCPGDIIATDVHMDLRVGGALLIVMRDANKSYEHRGEFTIIDPPAKLAFTWIAEATDFLETLVTVEFLPVSEIETEIVLTHENFPRSEVRDRYQGGWGQIVQRFDEYLHGKN